MLALPAPKPQLLLPAPKSDTIPVYVALRAGTFKLPNEPLFKPLQMAMVLGVFRTQDEADHAAETCKPGPAWSNFVQYVDSADLTAAA